jgi:hypothetical protein
MKQFIKNNVITWGSKLGSRRFGNSIHLITIANINHLQKHVVALGGE